MDDYKARNDFDYWLRYQVIDVSLLSIEEYNSFLPRWMDKVSNNWPM